MTYLFCFDCLLTLVFSRNVTDLKSRLEKLFGHPANKMRLYYVDQTYRDQMGPEEMKYPNKQLYSYNISTGDEIIIEPKK
jgi:tubulin-specific chaperone cofactor E-like protein